MSKTINNELREEILNKSIYSLMIKFSLPAIIAMSINSLNTFVDALFIGQYVGQEALAAVEDFWECYGYICNRIIVANHVWTVLCRGVDPINGRFGQLGGNWGAILSHYDDRSFCTDIWSRTQHLDPR